MLQTLTASNRHAPARQLRTSTAETIWRYDRVVVLANRSPLRHDRTPDGSLRVTRSSGGLVTALEPLMRLHRGTWIAHVSGNADGEVASNGSPLTRHSEYELRYLALDSDEYRGFYYGFANEGLWPLCHDAGVRPDFRTADFAAYQRANARFAAAVADETRQGNALVLVQDYHFALAPALLRAASHDHTIVTFWHIPWPRPRTFVSCPMWRELLDGLLGSDIIGFQTDADRQNFLGSTEALFGARVDRQNDTVTYRGRTSLVRVHPVGIDGNQPALRTMPPAAVCRERVKRRLELPEPLSLAVGVDRLDYTKGIAQKFLAVERLLEMRPDLVGRFVMVQVAEPSRDCLAAYRATRDEVAGTAARINARFGTRSYQPIRLLERHHDPREVYELYRAADLCHVGSLHDGMNLVAKEFVAARDDEQGVLVLSERTGAAEQLRASLLVDPRDLEHTARALERAVEMSGVEQRARMRLLRANVSAFDGAWWATELMDDAALIER